MISSDGYSIEQFTNKNRIAIYLPQTIDTLTHTMSMPKERRLRLSDTEMAVLLQITKMMYENEPKGEEHGNRVE